MGTTGDYSGTARHRRVLRAIVAFYADDPRVLAVALFGSLARGAWDEHSDLDLDIVLADGVRVDPVAELGRLCDALAPLGERAAVIVPDGDEAGDVVLASLLELSVRYHPLATTSPNIVESLSVLWGRIGADAIRAAGLARAVAPPPLGETLARAVRAAIEVDRALGRRRHWSAIEGLHRLRALLMALYSQPRGGARPLHTFEAGADRALQMKLAATLPRGDLASIHDALLRCLDLLERDLDDLADRQITLSADEATILRQIRARQAALRERLGRA